MSFVTRRGRALLLSAALAAVGLAGCDIDGDDWTFFGIGVGGGSYKSVTIGGKKWMSKNLDIATEDSWCYGEDGDELINWARDEYRTLSSSEIQANCKKYGRLYKYDAAKKACPGGWHLPTLDEWERLAESVGGVKCSGEYCNANYDWLYAGYSLKAASGWDSVVSVGVTYSGDGGDKFGFAALPGGNRYSGGTFNGAGRYGEWWTATENGGGGVYIKSLSGDRNTMGASSGLKSQGFSVRCVKN
jgi:uncharacterized protein (TIGR02145 family)